MLAAQVSNLASLGELGVADRVLTANEGIQVSERLGAVAVTWDRSGMNVVNYMKC